MSMAYGSLNLHNTDLKHVAGTPAQHKKEGIPQIAFSGRSNVGKSSLVNCLLGRKKLARVSGEPGKTITVNYYCVDDQIYFVDLPGYGFARRPKEDQKRWSAMTQSYFEENQALALVLQLIDIKVGATADDKQMLDYMNQSSIPYIVVGTKCDKLNKTELTAAVNKLVNERLIRPGTDIVLFSSTKSLGRDELWNRLLASITE